MFVSINLSAVPRGPLVHTANFIKFSREKNHGNLLNDLIYLLQVCSYINPFPKLCFYSFYYYIYLVNHRVPQRINHFLLLLVKSRKAVSDSFVPNFLILLTMTPSFTKIIFPLFLLFVSLLKDRN